MVGLCDYARSGPHIHLNSDKLSPISNVAISFTGAAEAGAPIIAFRGIGYLGLAALAVESIRRWWGTLAGETLY